MPAIIKYISPLPLSHVFCLRERKLHPLLPFELTAISSHLLLFGFSQAMIDATASESTLEEETGVRMVALFDHEEIGSNSAQGAGSPVMFDALSQITNSFTSDSKVVTIFDESITSVIHISHF